MAEVKIEPSWKQLLAPEFAKPYFEELTHFVKQEYQQRDIKPHPKNIFRAFELCPVNQTKVVILGQDPYHKVSGYTADGLAFSVHEEDSMPPSLLNIYKELKSDLGIDRGRSGNLQDWASQGVLLLNAILTVRATLAGSHHGKGWELFTDEVIKQLSTNKDHLVFILWGAYARQKKALIDQTRHLIVESAHPSPFSAEHGFFGSKPFSKTNDYLKKFGLTPINW